MRTFPHAGDEDPYLGGRLLFAGELNDAARPLAIAGNVAGAATLIATADAAAQRGALRDGVVDFLVTSLDETLRILKNEIRKGQTVAVCVQTSAEAVSAEMAARGVLPDLLGPGVSGDAFGPHPRRVDVRDEVFTGDALLRWVVESDAAVWMPKLDALAESALAPAERAACRWLRLAPRYCGRSTRGVRVLRCNKESADAFAVLVADAQHEGVLADSIRLEVLAN